MTAPEARETIVTIEGDTRIRIIAVVAGSLVAVVLVACGSGSGESEANAVRSASDAEHEIDALLHGASPSRYTIGESATPIAEAAMHDRTSLQDLYDVARENTDGVCTVLDLATKAADAVPASPAPVYLNGADKRYVQQNAVYYYRGTYYYYPQGVTNQTLQDVQGMAQGTLVEAANTVCSARQSGL